MTLPADRLAPFTEIPFHHTRRDGQVLRGRWLSGSGPLLVFLSGFRSVHVGEKATAVAAYARQHDAACLRFDYLGHGVSDGAFDQFRISEAIVDSAHCIHKVRKPGQPLYLIGSSMGGLIALALAQRQQIAPDGLTLVAPAVDFVSRRVAAMPAEAKATLATRGAVQVPDHYAPGSHYTITQAFLDDALALEPGRGPIPVDCPVRIIHGSADESVPITTSRRLVTQLPNATLCEVADGDHRLSDHLSLLLSELTRTMANSSGIPTAGS